MKKYLFYTFAVVAVILSAVSFKMFGVQNGTLNGTDLLLAENLLAISEGGWNEYKKIENPCEYVIYGTANRKGKIVSCPGVSGSIDFVFDSRGVYVLKHPAYKHVIDCQDGGKAVCQKSSCNNINISWKYR
ncbi:MAG: hypothetical protein MJZ41_12680 [Bacteroidaceae bacterium]|nr:hypothetical protein [Bacteroidaceae bacterium]